MTRTLGRVLAAATCAGAAALALPARVPAQETATIAGRVTGDDGQPLAAASVFIATLNLGTTTRQDSAYSFTVPAPRVSGQTVGLTARLVGYRP